MDGATLRGLFTGIIITVIGGLILAVIVGEGRFAPPQTTRRPDTQSDVEREPTTTSSSNFFEETEEVIPTQTPSGIRNPTGSIAAGQPIIVDDYQLYIDSNSYELLDSSTSGLVSQPSILLSIAVSNLSSNKRIFSYAPNSITLKDDTGRVYEHLEGRQCDSAAPFIESKSVQIEGNDSVEIHSYDSVFSAWWWCLEGHPDLIPWYDGNISPGANYLILEFDSFGPFSDFQVEIPI